MKKSPLGNKSYATSIGTDCSPSLSTFSRKAFIDKNPVIGRKIVLKSKKKKFLLKIDLSFELFFQKSSKSTICSMMNGTRMKLKKKKIKGEKYAVRMGTMRFLP
jgi:hypothetical protein